MQKKHIEQIVFIVLIICWLLLFVNGALNNAKLYLDAYSESQTVTKSILSAFALVATWTWSNLLILCCLSSLLGEFGRISMSKATKLNFIAALIRGFFIYFFLMAGQLIIEGGITFPKDYTDEVTIKKLEQAYIRLASVCTLFGFIVGFKPNYFVSTIGKFIGDTGSEG